MEDIKYRRILQPEDAETVAEILKATASSGNRLYTYIQLYQEEPLFEIAYQLQVTQNALQHYIKDWRELELVEEVDDGYVFTDLGDEVHNYLMEIYQGLINQED